MAESSLKLIGSILMGTLNEDKSFLVVFNQKAKRYNDSLMNEIANWSEVESTDYAAETRAHLPEADRYDRAVVTLKNEDNAADVLNRLESHLGIRAVVPPLKLVGLYRP